MAGDTVTMVIQKSAGIKNPSEAGSHSTGYAILGPTDNVPSGPSGSGFMKTNELATVAKIGLSDVDNKRGYEMTVTGSGFNDGTTADVYVLCWLHGRQMGTPMLTTLTRRLTDRWAERVAYRARLHCARHDATAPRSGARWSAATTRSR